ncbi:MAG: ADP-glyceromanno-heptose 6-epimerase [Rhodobacter sp.]|jgi:ADP-L-glycero-D-manno-heptose 6-epimerase|nr:ADP-glyceromanno-heptose 6-epimerase [Rhodobacter sp.]
MYLVTGGAGFIGSNLVAALVARGEEVVISDRLRDGEKWKNIAKHPVSDIVAPEDLAEWLGRKPTLKAVFHLGAISATTERNVDRIVANNLRLSSMLWNFCADTRTSLVYASSAATYGRGDLGFVDDDTLEHLAALRPLNPYGWSKALFDIQAVKSAAAGIAPPSWAGLKFFNVYGPNEYHKGNMRSVALQMYESLRDTQSVRLFRSADPSYPDGGQMRDFVWVGDCVQMMLWAADHGALAGVFNCGSGHGRTFLDLVHAVLATTGQEAGIDWVDTPPEIARHYQYFTQADMTRARAAGFVLPATSVETGVDKYLRNHLMQGDPYA